MAMAGMESYSKILLEPVVDLSNIDSLHKNCQAALDRGEAIVNIDASQVERLKTPIFQLIIIFKRTLESSGRQLVIESPSEGFESIARCLGLWDALQKDV